MINFSEKNIRVTYASKSRLDETDENKAVFGQMLTDHMLTAKYEDGRWLAPEIKLVENLSLSPLALCLHYGQTVFEGMKAYRQINGEVSIFRLVKHQERLNRSLERMCMPGVPAKIFKKNGLTKLVKVEQAWVSGEPGQSLYLRRFVIATEPKLGVKVSDSYLIILCSPIARYFSGNVKVKVEREYSRAVIGGAGFSKNGGNYGACLYPTFLGQSEGFDQLLWTDVIEHLYLEESVAMNLMIIFDKHIMITPPLGGTILDGVTRDCILKLANNLGLDVSERKISYLELANALNEKRHVEMFGVGTAAVITPIEMVSIKDVKYYPDVSESTFGNIFRKKLQDIRTGIIPDEYKWNTIIEANGELG